MPVLLASLKPTYEGLKYVNVGLTTASPSGSEAYLRGIEMLHALDGQGRAGRV